MNHTDKQQLRVEGLASLRVLTACVAILTIITVGTVLRIAGGVVLPLLMAWLISYMLTPLITFLTKRRVPTPLAVTLAMIFLVWICYLTGVFLIGRIHEFAKEYSTYEAQLRNITQSFSQKFAEKWKFDIDPFAGVDWDRQVGKQIGSYLLNISGSVANFISNLLMVSFFLIFILLGKPYFGYKLRAAMTRERAEKIDAIMSSIARQITRYLSVQFLISLSTGFLVWLALRIIGVDFAVTWGALAFFLNFIPTVGSIVASIPPILLALVQFYPSLWPALATLITLLTIQMVIGNGIAPKVMGDKLNLSPLVVLLSLVFWGWLWGIPGAIISVMLTSTLKIICENVETLKPISIMMGSGKPHKKLAERSGGS